MSERVRLVVLFGGRSAEHEVSCVSAHHVLRAVDRERYDVVPVGVTHDGRWVDARPLIESRATTGSLPSPDGADAPATDPLALILHDSGRPGPVVVLPLIHGTMGEDGTVQGLLEVADVPYVGAGVLASALCMDKSAAKDVLVAHDLPQARWLAARGDEVTSELVDRAEAQLGWPVFVKPANSGSSVGITKAADRAQLADALDVALRYDEYVVVEEGVDGREIEVAVLGNGSPQVSVPGEIVPSREFYDFEDKYVGSGAQLLIPAPLSDAEARGVQDLALRAYRALRVDGLARVDFFLEGRRGFLVNEVNTLPGFTPISMYPKLWEASGLRYDKLIDELVRLALERHERRAGFSHQR
ncbi:MAG: D-alanine--D-alanine ligase [Actinomycetota bacterium]|nr:D-alanine--D-alanine ligase [Actinomycetota bacterium]